MNKKIKKLPRFSSESLQVEVLRDILIMWDTKKTTTIEKALFVQVVPGIIDLIKHIAGGNIIAGNMEDEHFHAFIFEDVINQVTKNSRIRLKQVLCLKSEFPDLKKIEDITLLIPEGANIIEYNLEDFLNFCEWLIKNDK